MQIISIRSLIFGGKTHNFPSPRCRKLSTHYSLILLENFHSNLGIIFAYLVFFLAVYIFCAEYLSSDGSKGEVLVFQRSRMSRPPKKSSNDEEAVLASASNGRNTLARAASGREPQRPKQQSSATIFHWSNVCYDITIKGEPRRILDNVSGWVKPATLTALMVRCPYWSMPLTGGYVK